MFTLINDIMDCVVKGTVWGICLGFCIYGLVAAWKWFFGFSKRILHNLFPECRWFIPKTEENDKE